MIVTGDHDVHVCRGPTSAIDCGRVGSVARSHRSISTEEVAIDISQSPPHVSSQHSSLGQVGTPQHP